MTLIDRAAEYTFYTAIAAVIMMETVIQALLLLNAVWAGAGVVAAPLLHKRGARVIDPATGGAPLLLWGVDHAGRDRAVADAAPATAVRAVRAGRVTLVSELADTKCYLGVLRPATGRILRVCAVRLVLSAGERGRASVFDPQWAALAVVTEGGFEMHDGVSVLRTAAPGAR